MDTLYSLLERVKECFGVQICVHDVTGVTYSRASLNLPYVWMQHGCEYCSMAKACRGEPRCMQQKQLVMRRLERGGAQPFFGVCHMGVCEYILPVIHDGQLVAVVFASGLTAEDEAVSRQKIEMSLHHIQEPLRQKAMEGYEAFARSSRTTRDVLRFLAQLTHERIVRDSMNVAVAEGFDRYAVESVRQRQSGTVRAVLGYIEANLPGQISVKDISTVFFMSEGHLCRLFRREMGMSIVAYVKQLRMQRASQMLCDGSEPVSTIAARVGIGDHNYFCRVFKSVMGCTPTEYRAMHEKRISKGQKQH